MRQSVRNAATAAVLSCALAFAATPSLAQSGGEQGQDSDPGTLAREGAEKLVDALQQLLELVPYYGMPRIEDDGDIVIPRLDKPRDKAPEGGDAPEGGESGGATDTRT